jgi:hypothetical protein
MDGAQQIVGCERREREAKVKGKSKKEKEIASPH